MPTLPDINEMTFKQLRRLSEEEVEALVAHMNGKPFEQLSDNELFVKIRGLADRRGMEEHMQTGINFLLTTLELEGREGIITICKGVSRIMSEEGPIDPYDTNHKDAHHLRRSGRDRTAKAIVRAALMGVPAVGFGLYTAASGVSQGIESRYALVQNDAKSTTQKTPEVNSNTDNLQEQTPKLIRMSNRFAKHISDFLSRWYISTPLALAESVGISLEAWEVIQRDIDERPEQLGNAVAALANAYPLLKRYDHDDPPLHKRKTFER